MAKLVYFGRNSTCSSVSWSGFTPRLVALVTLLSLAASACGNTVNSGGDDDASLSVDPTGRDPAHVLRAEICDNGLDDDGNGKIDELCPCIPGDTQLCYTGDPQYWTVGACTSGNQYCLATDSTNEFGLWGLCHGSVMPSDEVCGDGSDQDCDGEDPPCTPTSDGGQKSQDAGVDGDPVDIDGAEVDASVQPDAGGEPDAAAKPDTAAELDTSIEPDAGLDPDSGVEPCDPNDSAMLSFAGGKDQIYVTTAAGKQSACVEVTGVKKSGYYKLYDKDVADSCLDQRDETGYLTVTTSANEDGGALEAVKGWLPARTVGNYLLVPDMDNVMMCDPNDPNSCDSVGSDYKCREAGHSHGSCCAPAEPILLGTFYLVAGEKNKMCLHHWCPVWQAANDNGIDLGFVSERQCAGEGAVNSVHIKLDGRFLACYDGSDPPTK